MRQGLVRGLVRYHDRSRKFRRFVFSYRTVAVAEPAQGTGFRTAVERCPTRFVFRSSHGSHGRSARTSLQ